MESKLGTLPKARAHRRTLSSFDTADSGSASLQKIWAENCLVDEPRLHSQNQSEIIITTPAPAVITKSILLTTQHDQDTDRHSRTHQRSLTSFIPFKTSHTASESPQRPLPTPPVKEKLDIDVMPTLTGDQAVQIRIAKNPNILSGWLSGTSEPASNGMTMKKLVEEQPTSPSRFAFFSKAPAPQQAQIPSRLCDDLLTLDIKSALLPTGDDDPFSPSAFKNLLMNAEGLLSKMQVAYRLRTRSLHEIQAEREAQVDELEEAETRAKHLKLQLEDMAQQVMSHEKEMKQVLGELVKERQARAEEKEDKEKSIALIKFRPPPSSEASSAISEDLEVDSFHRRRPWRRSDGTINSDMSFDSDDDSGAAESIFSRSMSPGAASEPENGMSGATPPRFDNNFVVSTASPRGSVFERPRSTQQRNGFQKILESISPTPTEDEEDKLGMATERCQNCRGGNASVAWDTVGLLRAENRGLKERVMDLELAVEGALDLVNGHILKL